MKMLGDSYHLVQNSFLISEDDADDNSSIRSGLGLIDVIVLFCYFAAFIGASIFAMCRFDRNTASGYFLAGRYLTFIPIGFSLFASNIGSEHFVGLAGSGAASGVAAGAFELNALFLLPLLGWVFLPVYVSSGVFTLPEYLHKRFGGRRIQVVLSILSLLTYVLTKISVSLYCGALIIHAALHWNIYYAIAFLIGLTAFCTITGGLAAVVYTDTYQAVLMLCGGLTLMGFAFNEVGGLSGLYEGYMNSFPNGTNDTNGTNVTNECLKPLSDSLLMLRRPGDDIMPCLGFLFGLTAYNLWYWCTDQVIVQRVLSAKNLIHGQGATLVAGYLKILPFFMIVLPGMASRVLILELSCTDPKTCEEICGVESGCYNLAYAFLVLKLMPDGLRGLMVAVMLAALVGSLTSIFNSASSLFTLDIYPLLTMRCRPSVSNRETMIVGRIFVVVITLLSCAWIPNINSCLGPPIAAVFMGGILWPRANEKGAFWSLVIGLLFGILRLVLDIIFQAPKCGEDDTRPPLIGTLHYMYYASLLFALTAITLVVISLLTKPLEPWRTVRAVYSQRHNFTHRPDDPDPLVGTEGPSFELQPIQADRLSNTSESSRRTCKAVFLRGFNWFCGFTDNSLARRGQSRMHVVNSVSDNLNRTPWVQRLLLAILVIMLVSGATILTLFSIPPDILGIIPPKNSSAS